MKTCYEISPLQEVSTTTAEVSAKHNGKQNYGVTPTNGLGEGDIKVLSDEELPGPEVGRTKYPGRSSQLYCYFIFIGYSLPRIADQYLSGGIKSYLNQASQDGSLLVRESFLH